MTARPAHMDDSATDLDSPAISAAASSFILVWAIELALARVTSQIQSALDIGVSALLLIGLPTLALVALRRLSTPAATRLTVAGLVGALPLAAVAAGIVLPIAAREAGDGVATLLGLLLAGSVVTNILSTRSGDGPAPSVGMILGVLVASAATAWVLAPAGFPPFQIHLPFLLAAVLLSRLAMRANAMPLVAMGGVAVAFWPAVIPPPPWHGVGAASDRADVVLLSVEGPAPEEVAALQSFEQIAAEGARLQVEATGGTADLLAQVLAVLPVDASDPGGAPRATLAERFTTDAYDTAAVVAAAPDLDVRFGFHRGFAVYHHFIDRNRYALPRWRASLAPGPVRDYAGRPVAADLLTWLGVTSPPDFASPVNVLNVAAQIMSERRKVPVFLWVHFTGGAESVDENVQHILAALGGEGARPRTIALLATPATASGATVPLAIAGPGAARAPAGGGPIAPDVVAKLLTQTQSPAAARSAAQSTAPAARSAAMRSAS